MVSLPAKEITIPQKEVYTYADYVMLPEGAPYQLIGGKLVMTPAPTTFHQIILVRLLEKLLLYTAKEKSGQVLVAPVDVYFEEKETYQPDIVFIAKDRLQIIEREKVKGAPDLIIEILSPSTAYYDLKKKAIVYARHGVKEYWIVDPEDHSIEVHQEAEGKYKLNQRVEQKGEVKSLLLDGFTVEAEEIFSRVLHNSGS
ncbi:MAG: Uma2 family endonuclease [Armatimonadetes bacterium]|nr:Uma2 family endonuclease [Armatimonadota bacterium]